MSFHNSYWIKATRKRHNCGWCGQIIEVGSASQYNAGMCEGDFSACHLHPECAHAKDSLTNSEWRDMDYSYSADFARGRKDDDTRAP